MHCTLSKDEDGYPSDLDIVMSGERINDDKYHFALIRALELMTTLELRTYDHDYVSGELDKASLRKDDFPAILVDLISTQGGDRVRSDGDEGEACWKQEMFQD